MRVGVELLLDLADAVQLVELLLATRLQAGGLLLEAGQLVLRAAPAARWEAGVLLLAQALALDLELHDAAPHLVQLGRRAGRLHAQPGGRLVDQVDRLVGQEAVGDVAVREHGRGHQRGVLDAHLVVLLVALAQAAQDADRVLDGRLADEDRLEAALQRGVLLDVLAVLVERGRADACAARRAPASA